MAWHTQGMPNGQYTYVKMYAFMNLYCIMFYFQLETHKYVKASCKENNDYPLTLYIV